MLRYALHLYDSTGLNVYPIALVSYPKSKRPLNDRFDLKGPDGHQIFSFRYRVIQLNRLHWRDYALNHNPVAAALMSRMGIPPGERRSSCKSAQRGVCSLADSPGVWNNSSIRSSLSWGESSSSSPRSDWHRSICFSKS